MSRDDDDSVTVARFESEPEAEAAAGLLRSGGIPCAVVRDRLGRSLPIPGARAYVRLRVPAAFREDAAAVLAEIEGEG